MLFILRSFYPSSLVHTLALTRFRQHCMLCDIRSFSLSLSFVHKRSSCFWLISLAHLSSHAHLATSFLSLLLVAVVVLPRDLDSCVINYRACTVCTPASFLVIERCTCRTADCDVAEVDASREPRANSINPARTRSSPPCHLCVNLMIRKVKRLFLGQLNVPDSPR